MGPPRAPPENNRRRPTTLNQIQQLERDRENRRVAAQQRRNDRAAEVCNDRIYTIRAYKCQYASSKYTIISPKSHTRGGGQREFGCGRKDNDCSRDSYEKLARKVVELNLDWWCPFFFLVGHITGTAQSWRRQSGRRWFHAVHYQVSTGLSRRSKAPFTTFSRKQSGHRCSETTCQRKRIRQTRLWHCDMPQPSGIQIDSLQCEFSVYA